MTPTESTRFSTSLCIECVRSKQEQVHAWLSNYEHRLMPPIYSSVDIRDAGFKIAVIDTNLFPAGFNNLCEHGLADAGIAVEKAIHKRLHPSLTLPIKGREKSNILIVAEEHTRNTWYLENIRILQQIVEQAGFKSQIATFFEQEPGLCDQAARGLELKTATNETVKIHCFKCVLEQIKKGEAKFDLIILNNDLSTGVPDNLRDIHIPIYPSAQAGWHSRLKSRHFTRANALIKEFGAIVGLDPWFFSCFHESLEGININEDADRTKLAQSADTLFKKIRAKHKEHGINEKPFVFVKSDSGTYGMGVVPIEHPDELIDLNRRSKNKLYKGKSSQVISRFLLQEGVSTIHEIDGQVSEVCVYQIDNTLIGGFYRLNNEKNARQNLNSTGMNFRKMCPHLDKYGRDCGIPHNLNIFDIYRILARIAGIAASMEIVELEKLKQ